MAQAKMQSFVEEGAAPGQDQSLKMPVNFSMFNKQTEFPYETIPNVFKISPPE